MVDNIATRGRLTVSSFSTILKLLTTKPTRLNLD
jgi:hypothetical protein